ncbi:sugar efflux transporter for intercellular exchange [Leptospira ryugenii]|uniref:Sugar efflux transporter for intercellular exchange n=2 Tax=Leptospira ryugenii TaxID=1917863 RepID=A0A2P2DWJ1_9LEPT|nr:sugar efflux transporter for intercellular exchange [Leptospira ryugenii]
MQLNMELLIGYIAAILTTLSYLPQVLRVILTKQTRDISRNMYLLQGLGVFLWLCYGVLLTNLPIILANAVTLGFVLTILYYKISEEKENETA